MQVSNGMGLVTGCPPRQAGPDSRLPAVGDAELLSPKHSGLTGAFSWDFQFIELLQLQVGRTGSTYNLLKFLLVFLIRGKKSWAGGGIKSERKPTAIQNSLRFIRSTAYSEAAII